MNTRNKVRGSKRSAAGFTLIEGLVAMLVMAFGILALVSLQSTFRNSSDEAKLRSEATRLAQQKLDQLRAFEQVDVDPMGLKVTYLGGVVDSTAAEVINPAAYSNTSFSRTWTATQFPPLPVPPEDISYKTVTVNVAWTDRRGAQQLSLSSVIASADPSAISTLGVGPGSTVVRRPKNRNINIPYPAVQLQGRAKSAFKPPGSNTVIVFDNSTGDVLGKCNNLALPAEDGTVDLTVVGDPVGDPTGVHCDQNTGYLLSGYVRFCTSNGCGASNQPGDAGAQYANAADPTLSLNSTNPLQLDSSNQVTGTPALTCYSARQVTLNAGSTVSDTGQANNQVSARFISYACIVYPVNHDSDNSTAPRWWGRVTINPSGWTIANSGSNYKVCRFTGDYNLNGAISNSEHPLWYRGVTGALDNQNYLVVPRANNCPTDKPIDAVNGDFSPANTVTHQTDGNTATGALSSFHCSTIACSGGAKVGLEAALATTGTDIKMQ